MDSDEGARMPNVEPDAGGSEAAPGSLRSRRADLAPIQENCNDGYRSGVTRSRTASWREPGVGSSNTNTTTSSGGSSGSYSWLSSSLRGRCPPLLSRLRRHAQNESAHSEGVYSRPQHLLRRWDDLEHKATQEEEDDDDDDVEEDEDEDEEEEEEEDEGAVGLEDFGAGLPCRLEDETLPDLEDASVGFSPLHRVGVYDNTSLSMGPLGAESQLEKETLVSSRDQEKLRKIKER